LIFGFLGGVGGLFFLEDTSPLLLLLLMLLPLLLETLLDNCRIRRPPFPFELLTVLLPFEEDDEVETPLDKMTTDAVVVEGHVEEEDDFPFRMLLTREVSVDLPLEEDSSLLPLTSLTSSVVTEA
jgi:hypothetical protein